jgi:hypothetical protein
MLHHPRSFNPITAKHQRQKVHEKHVNRVKRVCSWLYRGAKWNLKQRDYATAMLLLGQMTDFTEA